MCNEHKIVQTFTLHVRDVNKMKCWTYKERRRGREREQNLSKNCGLLFLFLVLLVGKIPPTTHTLLSASCIRRASSGQLHILEQVCHTNLPK